MNRIEERFWRHVNKTKSCWLWTAATSDFGHGRFVVATGIVERAHRFSWQIINGSISDEVCVCHKCDVPNCVNPDHLFIGTKKQNTQDMLSKQREVRGSKASWSKLTKDQVLTILSDERKQHIIANDYGICQQSVSLIKRRVNWAVIV